MKVIARCRPTIGNEEDGYWVWLIRLASGSTSVGIVADADAHPFNSFNTLEKAREWLRTHEPQCAATIEAHLDGIQDFRVMRDYSYGCEQVFSGDQRWCLTGESRFSSILSTLPAST